MKSFIVDVDITLSKQIFVEAENEEDAQSIVKNWIDDDPYYYAHKADAFVSFDITDVYEDADTFYS